MTLSLPLGPLAARPVTADPTEATELLVVQHRRLETLLGSLLDAASPAERRTALAAAGDALALHLQAEERVFYPAVRGARTDDILLGSLAEDRSLKRLVVDLLALSPADASFEARCRLLKEQAVHHHGEEEEHLFPAVHLLLDSTRREALGRDMLQLQDEMRRDGDPRQVLSGETARPEPLDR